MNPYNHFASFVVSVSVLTCSLLDAAAANPPRAAARNQRPMDFIENCGQWHPSTQFMVRNGSLSAWFENDAVRLQWDGAARHLVKLTFEDAAANPTLLGETKREAHYNFFFGHDPARWQTQVSAYASVLYRGLYPGIDMRVREEGGRLEYDLLLAPGAPLEQFVVRCEGVTNISLEADGALQLQGATFQLRQTPPKTWEVLPNGEKRFVECGFRRIDAQRYGFVAPNRDRNLAMVIDPGLEWSTFIGGSFSDELTTVALTRDGSGDILVAGYMNSTDFPFFNDPNFTPEQNRVFIARLNSSGTILRWATFLGGWHSALLFRGLAAAPDGGAAIVGQTVSPDFPTTPGAFSRTAKFQEAFVARVNGAGGLVFSTLLGGSGADEAYGVGFDPTGAIIVGGNTSSADFPTTPGAIDRTYAVPSNASEGDAHGDVFVTRFSSDGSAVTYSTYLGGQSADVLEDMVVDSQGFVTLVGWITGHNVEVFPTTTDAFDRTWNGGQDCFLARLKLDGAGVADLKYSTLIGGSNSDNFYGVAVDPNNPELVTAVGMTWSDNFPVTAGVVDPTNPRFSDLFESQAAIIVRFRLPAGGPGTRLWSTYFGPDRAANIRATDVTINQAGEPIVVGLMGSRDLVTTRGAFDRLPEGTLNGGNNFIARLTADATQAPYVSYFGGSLADSDQFYMSPALAYLGANSVLIASSTSSADFPVTAGAFDTTYGSVLLGSDGYVMRFTAEPDNSGDLTVGVPTILNPVNGARFGSGSLRARLEWSAVPDPSGIDGYEFELSTSPNFTSSIDGTSHTTEHLYPSAGSGESGLSLGTWFLRVRAADRAGNLGAWSATQSFVVGDAGAPGSINFLDTYPRTLVGGASAVGIIYMDKPAPIGGSVVKFALRYNTSVGYHSPHLPFPVTVPETITIPEGAMTALFDVRTAPVDSTVAVDIFTTINGVGTANHITVTPPGSTDIRDLVISPVCVTGGHPSIGKVTLKDDAPPGGVVVNLSTGHPQAARVPPSVTVPAGSRTITFPITTSPVGFDIDTAVRANTAFSTAAKYIFVKPANGLQLTSFTVNPATLNGGQLATGTITLNAPVPVSTWPAFDGLFVDISSSRPDVIGLAPFITIYSPSNRGTFTFVARNVPTTTSIIFTAAYDNFVLTAPVTLNAGPAVNVTSVGLNVSTVRGGQGGIATANLGSPAPAGGLAVTFSTSDPDLFFSSDPTVFASQGSTTASAAFIAKPVTATKVVNIIASYGNSSASAAVTINPSDAVTRWPTSLTLNPSTVAGGTPSTGTVTINTNAPPGGVVVQLSSRHAAATVPATVTVPPGATSASFSINTTAVSTNATAQIWALLNFSIASALNITAGSSPTPTPGTPSLLSPANDASVAQPVTLDWSDAANAASYDIQLDDSSSFSNPLVRSLTATMSQTTVSGLSTARHWWRVRARNSAGVAGNWSGSRRFRPQASPAAPSLSSLTLNPTSLVGGSTAQGTVSLSSPAPTGGAVVTLSNSQPSIVTTPASVTVAAGAISATFTLNTTTVSATNNVTISGAFGGTTRTATLTVRPAPTPPPPASLSALTLNPTSLVGGSTSQGTVSLSSAAPSGGAVVTLSNSQPNIVTTPASVTVAAGATSATFTLNTTTVSATNNVTVSGAFGGTTRTATFTVRPAPAPPPPASLSALTLNPTSVIGGNSSQGTVTLTSAAPSGGAVVTLSSSNTNAIVPATVTVAAGATSAGFTLTTRVVSSSFSATVSANYSNVTRTAALTINPVPTGPLPAPSLVSPANDARFAPGQNITFDWSDVSGAASYTIQIDDHDSFPSPWLVNQTVSTSTFSTSTLPIRTMWWRARALDAAGNPGNWSAIRRVEVKD